MVINRTDAALWNRPAIKQPAGYGPCAAERPGWPVRRGCASGAETRASCGGAGCWAGTYACSREGSQVGSCERIESVTPSAASWRSRPDDCGHPPSADSDRLTNGTWPGPDGQTSSRNPAEGTFRQLSGQLRLYCCGQRVVLDRSQLLASSRHRDAFPGNSQQFGIMTPCRRLAVACSTSDTGQHSKDIVATSPHVASTAHGPRLVRPMATLGDDRPITQRAQSVDKDVD